MNKDSFQIIDISSAEHYHWANVCDGWHFVKTDELSVIRESMPSGTEEKIHYHQKAQQFFYILSGIATFEIAGNILYIKQNQGIHIHSGVPHKISNLDDEKLDFLVISQPIAHGDRVEDK